MFDRAARATWCVGATPYVDIAVLTALATLLQDVTSVSGAPSQFGCVCHSGSLSLVPRTSIACSSGRSTGRTIPLTDVVSEWVIDKGLVQDMETHLARAIGAR